MIHIAICDDFKRDREKLKINLSQWFHQQSIPAEITEYSSGESIYADLSEHYVKFDLIFMDIYMDQLNGMQTARLIRNLDQNVQIVFLTTSADFAVEGYEIQSFAYLLKPLDSQKFEDVLSRFMLAREKQEKNYIVIEDKSTAAKVLFHHIRYVESSNHYVMIHTVQGEHYKIYSSFAQIEQQLTASNFLKCNRGYIVNMDYVSNVNENFVMDDGTIVPIKVRERKTIREIYYAYVIQAIN